MLAQQITGPSPMEVGNMEHAENKQKHSSGFNSSAEHSALSQWKIHTAQEIITQTDSICTSTLKRTTHAWEIF